jgi:hypothetical protein
MTTELSLRALSRRSSQQRSTPPRLRIALVWLITGFVLVFGYGAIGFWLVHHVPLFGRHDGFVVVVPAAFTLWQAWRRAPAYMLACASGACLAVALVVGAFIWLFTRETLPGW